MSKTAVICYGKSPTTLQGTFVKSNVEKETVIPFIEKMINKGMDDFTRWVNFGVKCGGYPTVDSTNYAKNDTSVFLDRNEEPNLKEYSYIVNENNGNILLLFVNDDKRCLFSTFEDGEEHEYPDFELGLYNNIIERFFENAI